jgi:hypothetical protein
MKTNKLLPGLLLAITLLASFAVLTIQSQPPETIFSYMRPRKWRLDQPAPSSAYLFLWFPYGSDHQAMNIDPETMLIGGILPAEDFWMDEKLAWLGIAEVDGEDFVDLVVWPLVYHMNIPPDKWKKLDGITVTGELYDGTLFEGTFKIKVFYNPAPPPPPPS